MTTIPPSAGVIGWPVGHSKSPLIHRFWLAKLGIDGDYSRFPVAPERLGEAIRALPALGLRGVNVTVPHKVKVLAHLDAVDTAAQAVGAVNAIVAVDGQLVGYNTDVDGVLEPLSSIELAGRTAVVLGAGGAARAVVAALVQRGVGEIHILNRDIDRARAVLAAFSISGSAHPLGGALPPAKLLINATSLGMTGQPLLDINLAALPDEATVFDLVYAPIDTDLLTAARARGLWTIDGLSMLIGQAAAAFALFFGAAAPREHDAELRALLSA